MAMPSGKRSLVAAAIVLIGSVAPTALAGFADQVTLAEPPKTFHIAPAWDGDYAAYNWTHYDEDGTVLNHSAESTALLHRWVPVVYDGRLELASERGLFSYWGCGLNGEYVQGYLSELYVNDTHVGSGKGCDFSEDPVVTDDSAWGRRALWMQHEAVELGADALDHQVPFCGFPIGLQGGAVATKRLPELFSHCAIHHDDRRPSPTYEAIGVADYGGQEALVVQGTVADDQRTYLQQTWWFVADLPFPVRMRMDGTDDTDRVWEMVRFSRGNPPDVKEVDVTPPALRDWGRYGPANDADHPFPLEEAFTRAIDAPDYGDLREYMDAHPESVVQWADYQERSNDNASLVRQWSFAVSDGTAPALGVIASEDHERATAGRVGQLTGVTGPYMVPTYDFQTTSGGWGSVQWRHPDELPKVPPVSWLLQQHERVFSEKASGWTIQPDCALRCEGRTYVGATQTRSDHQAHWAEEDIFFASAQTSLNHRNRLLFHPDGTMASAERQLTADTYGPDAEPVPPERQAITAQATEVRQVVQSGWHFAPDVATGTGIVAGIAALLYWGWPMLKGGVPMFTRIQRQQVLDQPVRRRIHELILAQPGIHLADLRRDAEVGAGTVRHHVRRLVDAGLVRVIDRGGYSCHLPSDADAATTAGAGVLRSGGAKAVLEAMRAGPTTAADIKRSTGLAEGTVHYHLRRLEHAGVAARHNGQYALV